MSIKQAIEALLHVQDCTYIDDNGRTALMNIYDPEHVETALAALRAMPAEPVAWRWVPSKVWKVYVYTDDLTSAENAREFVTVEPLYATPHTAPVPAEPVPVAGSERYISASKLSKMFEPANTDPNQWGHYWKKGWNDALRQAMDYAQEITSGPPQFWVNPNFPTYATHRVPGWTPLYATPHTAPVGEIVALRGDYDGHGYQYIDSGSGSDWRTRNEGWEPLYATTPTAPKVVSSNLPVVSTAVLSDAEIQELWDEHKRTAWNKPLISPVVFARAIERAVRGEKL